jgi:malyl-CoA/(S)-citramalyl-CoA lyase
MLEKASQIESDVVMLDLEDAVAPQEKPEARANVIRALRELRWSARSLSLRVNGLDTEWCYRDLAEVVESTGEALDMIVVPKVCSAGDVHFVATLLDQIEIAIDRESRIGLSILIESAAGMANVNEIAAACPDRMEALVFGVADYAASLQSATTSIGGFEARYAVLTGDEAEDDRELHCGDQWHYALSAVAIAARANDLRPIDGPYGAIRDLDGYRASARRAAVLGYEGKWAIHPSQVGVANQVFTPDDRTVERTCRMIEAMRVAALEGTGAVTLDGALVDGASLRIAQRVLDKVERINGSHRPGDEEASAEAAGRGGGRRVE